MRSSRHKRNDLTGGRGHDRTGWRVTVPTLGFTHRRFRWVPSIMISRRCHAECGSGLRTHPTGYEVNAAPAAWELEINPVIYPSSTKPSDRAWPLTPSPHMRVGVAAKCEPVRIKTPPPAGAGCRG